MDSFHTKEDMQLYGMKFKTWLKQYKGSDFLIHDLRRDVLSDKEFPSSNELRVLMGHMNSVKACREAKITLVRAYKEFKAFKEALTK